MKGCEKDMGTELKFEEGNYCRKRVNIDTSFPWFVPLRIEFKGQLSEVEI